MKKLLSLALTSAALAMLAGCGNAETDSNGDGKISRDEIAKAASSIKLEPGEWEHKVEIVDVNFDDSKIPESERAMASQMMKAMVGKVSVNSSCLTPEQAAKPDAGFLAGNDKDNCEYKKFDVSGGKIDAAIVCAGKAEGEQGEFAMTGDYASESYTMAMTMKATSPGMGTMTMKAKNSARRTGECKK